MKTDGFVVLVRSQIQEIWLQVMDLFKMNLKNFLCILGLVLL